MQICFFEDSLFSHFHPLTLTRPADDLRVGVLTIAEKWETALSADKTARVLREELKQVFGQGSLEPAKPCIWINSRYLPTPGAVQQIRRLDTGSCLKAGSTVIAANVEGAQSVEWLASNQPDFNSLFVLETEDFTSIEYLWDLFQMNGLQIKRDLEWLDLDTFYGEGISGHAVLENETEIYVEEGAVVEAGCILDARKGPVYIGEDATVMAGSILRGPVAICKGATVKAGAKIYEDTTIGPVCKVGGEVNNCIFHSYSNKAHDGFTGNSVFGQWCNLGADTNTSNLKNNYSTVRITDWVNQEETETNQQFFGTVMGDHSKTAINTQLNTGTVCGVSCNIFSGDFPPKFIPSFSWVGSNVIQTYHLDKALETMEAMMARRNIELTEGYKKMMKSIFEQEHN